KWPPPHHSWLPHGCGACCFFVSRLFGQSECAETLCLRRECFTRSLLLKLQLRLERIGWFQQRFSVLPSGENPRSNFIHQVAHNLLLYLKGLLTAMRPLQRT